MHRIAIVMRTAGNSGRREKKPRRKSSGSVPRPRKAARPSDGVPLALTVRQPWASLIAAGFKTIENRSWERRSVLGKRIAIHAGKATPIEVDLRGRPREVAQGDNPRGAIVCTAVVQRFVTSSPSFWFSGPVGWVLTEVRPCKPIPCSGALGLWTVPPRIASRLRLRGRTVRR